MISRNNQSRNNSFTTLKWSIWHHITAPIKHQKRSKYDKLHLWIHTHILVSPHHHHHRGYLCLFHKNANKILCVRERGLRYYFNIFFYYYAAHKWEGGGHIINWKALLSVIAFLCVFLFHLYRFDDAERDAFVDNIKSKGKHHTQFYGNTCRSYIKKTFFSFFASRSSKRGKDTCVYRLNIIIVCCEGIFRRLKHMKRQNCPDKYQTFPFSLTQHRLLLHFGHKPFTELLTFA